MHVSVGRLRFKSTSDGLRFLWRGALAYLQARRAKGIIYASVYREDWRTLWSLSVWSTSEAMLNYRNTGSHLRVMKMAPRVEARVDFRHWEAADIPTWEDARSRLREEVDQ